MAKAFKLKVINSPVVRSLKLLPKKARRRIWIVAILQSLLGILDLVGVAAIGILGALAVTGIQSQSPGGRISHILELLRISNLSFQSQIAVLGIGSALILIFRTLISLFFIRKVFYFLGRQSAQISSNLTRTLLSQNVLKIQSRSTQETLYAITAGVSAITLNMLGAGIMILADSSLLLIMLIGLFIADPVVALATLFFFGFVGYFLYKIMYVKAHYLGFKNAKLSVISNEKIIEVLESFREAMVRGRRDFYAKEIEKVRFELVAVQAETQLMPNISKYVIESAMVVGAVLVAAIQFGLKDATHAVATLSIFLAAGTRIAPAILRLQQSLIQIKTSLGAATPTLGMIESMPSDSHLPESKNSFLAEYPDFIPRLIVKSISFKYQEHLNLVLKNIHLEIHEGSSLAVVGPSGAGKTTFVDVLLGLHTPTSGSIEISGLSPLNAITKWPGAISYVPQDITMSNGSVRENVALGYPIDESLDSLVWDALRIAQLDDFVKELPRGLDTPVGERGTKLSGGQRQRLGIARAMFTKPKLLVLDEATSSLDGQSEADISRAIENLRGSVTIIMIAHRLSSVRHVDRVAYMEFGEIRAVGSFEEVRAMVPDFDRQAQLMGL